MRREFELHELAVEDAIKAHQRPKLEIYGDALFMVLKAAYVEPAGMVDLGEIQLFIGEGYLITVRHGDGDLHDARLGVEKRPDLLRRGPAAAVHAIVDRVVDDYAPVMDAIDRQVREVEGEVFSPSRANRAERIYTLKREVLELHDAVAPLLEPRRGIWRAAVTG